MSPRVTYAELLPPISKCATVTEVCLRCYQIGQNAN